MNSRSIDYYFWMNSDWAYLGADRLEAVAAGVFGSPSYVYRGELFWGQDRLDMLEECIAAPKSE